MSNAYVIWERGLYKSGVVMEASMFLAVEQFAGAPVLHLSGPTTLSSKMNPVRWITKDGTAREFTAYEVHDEY